MGWDGILLQQYYSWLQTLLLTTENCIMKIWTTIFYSTNEFIQGYV